MTDEFGSWVEYNGYRFKLSKMAVSITPNKDSSGLILISYTIKFDILGIISESTEVLFAASLHSALNLLRQEGKIFYVKTGPADTELYKFGPQGSNFNGFLTGKPGAGDAIDGGPFPSVINHPQSAMIGEKMCQLNFGVEITVKNLDMVFIGMGTDPKIVDFVWTTTFSIALNQCTTRKISGSLTVAWPTCADTYRDKVLAVFPAMAGFKRTMDFTCEKRTTVLQFSINDEELVQLLPLGVIDFQGTFRWSITNDLSNPVSRTLSGSLTGPKGVGVKANLLNILLGIFVERFKGVKFIEMSSQEVTENLFTNEIQFNFTTKEKTTGAAIFVQNLANNDAKFRVAWKSIGDTYFDKGLPLAIAAPIAPPNRGTAGLTCCNQAGNGAAGAGGIQIPIGMLAGEIAGGAEGGAGKVPAGLVDFQETYITKQDHKKILMESKGGANEIKKTAITNIWFFQVGVAVGNGMLPRKPAFLFPKEELFNETSAVETKMPNLSIVKWQYVALLTDNKNLAPAGVFPVMAQG